MIGSILVPLDGSEFGEHALPMAAELAHRAGATIHLVHVHESDRLAGVALHDLLDQHMRDTERVYLDEVAQRVRAAVPIAVETALIDGPVPATLREYTATHLVSLVVMSTHGRGALGRFWLGSVADELMRELPVPVLLIRPGEGKPDLVHRPQVKSILVPLDGSLFAEKVLEPALALGQLFDAEYTLVRVNSPIIRPAYLPDGGSALGLANNTMEQIRILHREFQEEAQRYLDTEKAHLAERGLCVHTRMVFDEEPAAGVLRAAKDRHADLIAVETHARRGLSRLWLGSVAEKLVRAGNVPILVSRAAR
jgi:nucleotide-binding universal stress UspA family protein